jgi:hypothetical protein
MHNLWMAMTGASVGHHEEVPGLSPQSANVGHEPDRFDARTIVGVPVVVTIVLVLTYLIVQGAFAFVNGRTATQQGDVAFNDRVNRIGTTDGAPAATPDGKPMPAVAQPNLEYMRVLVNTRPDANGKPIEDPPYLRSFKPTPTGNSPEIYPEDLRAERFVDPTTRTRALVEPSWVVKDKTAVIPIDQAIHLMAHDAAFQLKVAEKPAAVKPGTIGKAKQSTGGLPAPVPEVKKDDTKKDDHKH